MGNDDKEKKDDVKYEHHDYEVGVKVSVVGNQFVFYARAHEDKPFPNHEELKKLEDTPPQQQPGANL